MFSKNYEKQNPSSLNANCHLIDSHHTIYRTISAFNHPIHRLPNFHYGIPLLTAAYSRPQWPAHPQARNKEQAKRGDPEIKGHYLKSGSRSARAEKHLLVHSCKRARRFLRARERCIGQRVQTDGRRRNGAPGSEMAALHIYFFS